MLREIRVYGQLAKFLGRRKFMAAVDSAAEAIRFLLANYPQVERHMCQEARHYRVIVGDHAVGMEELHGPAGSNAIKIVPVIGGAGGGVGQILAGATVTKIGLLGGALILGGISQALTPTPTLAASSTYSGPQGTAHRPELGVGCERLLDTGA